MPRKSNQKKQKSKYNKKNKRYNKKKTLSKKQYKAVKKIAYSVSNNYRNKEYSQVSSSFYITNCGSLYDPVNPAAYNEVEFKRGNFSFYPLTNLGALEDNMTFVPSRDFLNLKSTNFLVRWVNSAAGDKNSDRIGIFSGIKFSIHSIQVKGVVEMNNYQGYAKPGRVGFRIVRQKYNNDRYAITTFNDAEYRNIIPQIDDVYKGMTNYTLENQDAIDRLNYAFLRDPKFKKTYPTVLKKYLWFTDSDLTVHYKKKTFNVFKKFKYPLQIIYPENSSVTNNSTNAFMMSLKNNLFFCPYFSVYDGNSTPGTNLMYQGTNHEFSIDGTYRLYGQIIINYTDS